ncbi:hypothetical protein [Streptomyces althioticus]|uniref:hypothetical protein n=1 Tax=Streptomyces althioticus TaxID=83380 RepID=UPI0034064FDB
MAVDPRAAKATAERIVAQVGDWDGGEAPRVMVTVVDPDTHQRLATTFVTVQDLRPSKPVLRLVDRLHEINRQSSYWTR